MTEGAAPETATRPSTETRRIFLTIGGAVVALLLLGFAVIPGCACSRAPTPPSSPVDGVVVAVDSQGLGRIRGFSLLSHGTTYRFALGTLDNASSFSPSHITEHMASSQPVRVYFRVEGSTAVVYRIEDAQASPGPT